MFAATTTDALIVADPASLKKYPSSIPSCLDLIQAPTASSWSPDNTFLYISSSYIIHRYEPTSNFLKDVYTHPTPISCLVVKDRHQVIFSSADSVHTLECDPNPRITQTFDSHKSTITSLSISNDNSLLSSTSAGAVHVHNLALGSHVAMRGLPTQGIVTSVFHPHIRTRLLVAAGRQLMVCDTTRPSGPVKTIQMNDPMAGNISAVACSPFSKTLVAVATSSGFVGLIDLEKEKALFRTLNLKTNLTTIGFSPEGAAIYFGSSTGKLLVLDLRALDKPPKSISLNNNDIRVQTISIQKKVKAVEGGAKTPVGTATATKKTPAEPVPPLRRATSTTTSKAPAKTLPSPARPRTVIGVTPTTPLRRRVPSVIKEVGINKTPLKGQSSKDPKKVLSPARDPLGNSGSGDIAGQLDELADRRRGKTTTTPTKPLSKSPMSKPRSRTSPSRADTISGVLSTKTESENPRRARTLPSATSTSALSSRKASTNSIPTSTSENHRLNSHATAISPVRRQRTVSSASRAASEAVSAISSTSRSTKSGTAPSSSTSASASRPSSSASRPASSLTSRLSKDSSSSPLRSKFSVQTTRAELSRTPSPDLPDIHVEPVTPVPAQKQKKKGMEILGLGTPEVDRWIQAGKEKEKERQRKTKDLLGKRKNVGFEDEDFAKGDGEHHDDADDDRVNDHDEDKEMERTLSMQISPRRPLGTSGSGSGSSDNWATSPPNPLPGPSSSLGGGGGPGTSAQDLLKTIVQDVLFDFQQETKAEMMGLHLDLLRMGRGWKTELRTLMDEYVGDLRDLREENQRLRLENERLRRGY